MMKISYIRTVLVAAFLALFIIHAYAEPEIVQERISEQSENCSNPRVIVNKQGQSFTIWQGLEQDRSRIYFRERQGQTWGPEMIIDRSEWGNNTNPRIALDQTGQPHVVWAFSDEEVSAVHYAFRIETQWFHSEPIRKTSGKNCEFPTIKVEAQSNRVFITWQEGRGSDYAVFCSTQDINGQFTPVQISHPVARAYNIYPEIFITPTPLVAWYGMSDADIDLHAAIFNIQTREWMEYQPAGFENLPVNRFPYLMTDSGGILYALWFDSDGATDRIFFSRQAEAESGKGEIVDDNPERMNNIPSGVVDADKNVFICWRGESLFGGQIFLSQGENLHSPYQFKESRLISDGQNLFYTQPDCFPCPNRGVDIVWISNALDGGNGAVYYRRVRP